MAPLRVMYTMTVPNHFFHGQNVVVDVRSNWLFSSCLLAKTAHLFFGQKLVKTATVHTLLQQPLHSRVAPLLCLPLLASSQLGDK